MHGGAFVAKNFALEPLTVDANLALAYGRPGRTEFDVATVADSKASAWRPHRTLDRFRFPLGLNRHD